MSLQEQSVVETAVADAQQTSDISSEAQPTPEPQAQDTAQDRNWREMRQTMEELKNRNQALETEVAQMRTPPPEPEEESDLVDDDISTVGMTKKLIQKEATRIAQDIELIEMWKFASSPAHIYLPLPLHFLIKLMIRQKWRKYNSGG